MRILLAALTLMLPVIAWAQTPTHNKVALMSLGPGREFIGNSGQLQGKTHIMGRLLRSSQINHDTFIAQDTTKYGEVGLSDNEWFSARYDAIIIPAQMAITNTATDPQNFIHLGFRDNAVRHTFNSIASNAPNSPYKGWDIPVFVISNGAINNTTPSFENGAQTDHGSGFDQHAGHVWRNQATGDTLFFISDRVELDASGDWASLITQGVTNDTSLFWHYQPDTAKPGVYWCSIREVKLTGEGPDFYVPATAEAILLGKMCQVTGIKPRRPFLALHDLDHPYVDDDPRSGANEVFLNRDFLELRALLDDNDWKMAAGMLPGYESISGDPAAFIDDYPDSMRIIASEALRTVFSPHVHDHFHLGSASNDSPGFRSAQTDTADIADSLRVMWKLGEGTQPNDSGDDDFWKGVAFQEGGSFGKYYTIPTDDVGTRIAIVLANAGARVIRGIGGANTPSAAATARINSDPLWSGRLGIRRYAPPQLWRQPGPNPQSIVTQVDKPLVRIIGSNIVHPAEQYSATQWANGVLFSRDAYIRANNLSLQWFNRMANYFHGQGNMDGLTADMQTPVATLRYMKYRINLVKMTEPFLIRINERNSRFLGESIADGN